MKNSLAILIATFCAAGTLGAAAAMKNQTPTSDRIAGPSSEQQPKRVRTGDWEYATPQFVPLESHPVRTWGGAVVAGPRNSHVSEAHGGLLATGARFDIPGRE